MRIGTIQTADWRTLRFASISGGMIVSVMAEAAIFVSKVHESLTGAPRAARSYAYRCNDGCLDSMSSTFLRKRLGERNETHLGGAVVCLTKIPCDSLRKCAFR